MKETKDDKKNVQEKKTNNEKPIFPNIKALDINSDFKHIEQAVAEERFEEF